MMIETLEQYIRSQQSRWSFYAALVEMTARPDMDPQTNKIFIDATVSMIEDIEKDLQEYESAHGVVGVESYRDLV